MYLLFLYAIFNNSPHNIYVNNCVVLFDVIKPLRGIYDKQTFTEYLALLTNCSVNVTVAVDKYVNSSIYNLVFMRFYDLRYTCTFLGL